MKQIQKKLSKELLLYLFFGGCSFFLNIILYEIFTEFCGLQTLSANLIDWIITMIFVFCTNERWVFSCAEGTTGRKIVRFTIARTGTLMLEEFCLYIFIDILNFSSVITKIGVQIFVIIINYILSRSWVFKTRNNASEQKETEIHESCSDCSEEKDVKK